MLVETPRGSFLLPNGAQQRLLDTLRMVAAANQAGARLPDERPVGEAAISRLTGAEPDAATVDRGLTRSEP